MLRVKNLTKIYKSKHRKKVKALDNVSFTLPESGMIFIIGKSGSGKSTLLNMLGGLDEITQGEIIVDGNRLSSFSHKDYDDYRNTCVGFIFQDFHLLDDLTVAQNVALSLDLQAESDKAKVLDALKRVDLEGYEKRYPVELSGGQKQRVAIARALVKNPTVLLADEPTGNLDTKTTGQVLDLLKEISKTKLVLVVSHNLEDADKYADRILELSDGKLVSDLTRRADFNENVELENGILKLPYLKKLTTDDKISIMSAFVSRKVLLIEQHDDKFVKVPQEEYIEVKKPIKRSGIKRSKLLALTGRFVKGSVFQSMFSAFMAACIIIILALSQTIVLFDPAVVIKEELLSSNQTILAMQKNRVYEDELESNLNTETFVELDEGDAQAFRSDGYKGGMYELTNYSLSIVSNYSANQRQTEKTRVRTKFYVRESFGTLITTEQFLVQKFGVNGEIPLLCGTLDAHPGGVIITDYFADSILAIKGNAHLGYDQLLGVFKDKTGSKQGYINAVINTGYKERYKDLLEMYRANEVPNYSELSKDQTFLAAYDEIVQYLAIGYSVNPNFKEDCKAESLKARVYPGKIIINGAEVVTANKAWFAKATTTALEDNEIIIGYSLYNHIFGTSYGTSNLNTFVPHTIQLTTYRAADELQKTPLHAYTFTVKALSKSGGNVFYCSETVFNALRANEFITYGLYFDNLADIGAVYETGLAHGFVPNSVTVQSTATMSRAVKVFSDVFYLISLVLYAACVSVLVNFGVKAVRGKTYEIGVIKALGGKSRNLSFIFSVEIFIVGLLTCVFSWVGMYLFIGAANDVLVASLAELATTHVVKDMNFLVFNPMLMAANSIGVFVLTLFSSFVPIFALKNVKPINIIKAKG